MNEPSLKNSFSSEREKDFSGPKKVKFIACVMLSGKLKLRGGL
jgi:hypothetical protein